MHAPQQQLYYSRIADAIAYINTNHASQPTLGQMAAAVHMSPFHFQRVFARWAGVSPKKFLQFISLKQAQQALQRPAATLFDAASEAGLSGTGRLHDLFVNLLAMTPGEYKRGGANLNIAYSYWPTAFGQVLVASTPAGICHVAFAQPASPVGLQRLQQQFPNASFQQVQSPLHLQFMAAWQGGGLPQGKINLHVKGTGFQVKVWEALLSIPEGQLVTYGHLAQAIGQPSAARAVGTAIGANPVAYLIPCHRVIRSSGVLGGYMWGQGRKAAIIGWEAARHRATSRHQ
jgi:AraC family transcriptional regulator of adaptative response/methylated-DNA-[protein]-cysteine methyltransferase